MLMADEVALRRAPLAVSIKRRFGSALAWTHYGPVSPKGCTSNDWLNKCHSALHIPNSLGYIPMMCSRSNSNSVPTCMCWPKYAAAMTTSSQMRLRKPGANVPPSLFGLKIGSYTILHCADAQRFCDE